MAVELLEETVKYQAGSKLLEIAELIADTGRPSKISEDIRQGFAISAFLQALDYGTYLTKEERDRIVFYLVEIANVNNFPSSPVISETPRPNVLIGNNSTITQNITYSQGTPFTLSDADTGDTVADTFSVSSGSGAVWFYTITYVDDTIQQSGTVTGSWLPDGSLFNYNYESTEDIGGTVDATLSIDISSGNVQLIITTTSDNWKMSGTRYLIP